MMRCVARPWTSLLLAALFLAFLGAAPAPAAAVDLAVITEGAAAANCLTPVGSPWEAGDNVYIKVKNNCTVPVGFSWEMGTYNYGVYGSPIGTPKTGSRAVKPGKTTTLCAKKPTTRGRYCFRFKIKNKDQTKPDDEFKRWLNNIVVAMVPGGPAGGTLEVGGSGLLANDVILAVAAAPPGWSIDLSTSYVSTAEFPATVAWEIHGPPDVVDGDTAYLRVEGYDAVTGDYLAEAEFQVVVTNDPDTTEEPIPVPLQGRPTVSRTGNGDNGEPPGPPDEEPIPVDPPQPNFYAASEQNGQPISGRELLVAWDENGFLGPEAELVFEYLGPDGWEQIATEADRAKESPLGKVPVYWDTTELPAGEYLVRLILTGPDGQVGTLEQVLKVTKPPVAEPSATFSGSQVTFDGNASYDPDGAIAEWEWTFEDGTVQQGSVVTHDFGEPGTHTVDLTVTDLEGNETTAYCLADIATETVVCDARSCGCESMKVKGAGDTAGMDMFWMTAPDKKKLGGVNTVPDPLPGAGGPYRLFYNFEVEAKLKPGSDATKCSSEQWANRTATYGGNTDHKKDGDGNEYPYGSDDYTPDNYTGGGGAHEVKGGFIRWVDGPGLDPLAHGDVAGTGASYSAQFFAIVTGPQCTCQCSWEVVMAVDGTGKATQPPKLQNVNCS